MFLSKRWSKILTEINETEHCKSALHVMQIMLATQPDTFISFINEWLNTSIRQYFILVYTTQMNSTFRALGLTSSEVITIHLHSSE